MTDRCAARTTTRRSSSTPRTPSSTRAAPRVYESLKKHYSDAIDDWEKVLALIGKKPTDRLARRDARRHIVQLVTRWIGRQGGRVRRASGNEGVQRPTIPRPATSSSSTSRADRRQGEPRATLEKLHTLVPDDQDVVARSREVVPQRRASTTRRSRCCSSSRRSTPAREREVYQQISEIKTEARKDDEAIEWAQKALAKSPSDPDRVRAARRALRRDAAVPRSDRGVREDRPARRRATARRAFALAQLYVQTGTPMKATELLRNVAAQRRRTRTSSAAPATRRSISRR